MPQRSLVVPAAGLNASVTWRAPGDQLNRCKELVERGDPG